MRLIDYKTLTFDVYGTLIDWESGMIAGLKPLTDRLDPSISCDAFFEAHQTEPVSLGSVPKS